MDAGNLGAILGTISAGLVVAIGLLFRWYSRLKLGTLQDGTESEALKLLSSAVTHWRGLYETSQEQVTQERMLRELAEARGLNMANEMEALRAEVAGLRREVERLTFVLNRRSEETRPGL